MPLEESGRFGKLLRNPRKRKYQEIEEDKVDENIISLKKMNIQKDQTIEELKGMISKFEHERLELMEDQDKLAKLYQMGVIDSKGTLFHSKKIAMMT